MLPQKFEKFELLWEKTLKSKHTESVCELGDYA